NEFLRPWGLSFGSGIVRDLSSLVDDPSSVVSFDYPSKSPVITRLDDDNVPVVATNALPVERTAVTGTEEDEPYVSPLVRSSARSWMSAPDGPRKGPFLLAAVTDAAGVTGTARKATLARTRVGVVGAAEMASNRFTAFWGNRQFL